MTSPSESEAIGSFDIRIGMALAARRHSNADAVTRHRSAAAMRRHRLQARRGGFGDLVELIRHLVGYDNYDDVIRVAFQAPRSAR